MKNLNQSNNVLFISVHPDDETFGCGGTILKHKAHGDKIHWLNLTGISKDHPYKFSDEQIRTWTQLPQKIKKAYGFDTLIDLSFPTIMLDTVETGELISGIDKAIKKIKPGIIYIPNRSDVHSDHRIAFKAICACTKDFRNPFIKRILMYETLSETEFAPALSENAFSPNYYSDISAYYERKIELMKLYDTEVMPDPYPRSIHAMHGLMSYRGSRIGVMYAEAFVLLFEKD